jgi:para-nitrobenzyl esterase
VTVFGESAGAASVAMLMVMPVAAGLFHRGIAESVPAFLFGSDLAAEVATIVAERLGLRASAGDLAGVPPQALADAIAGIEYQDRWGYALAVRRSQFGPVIDGEILPDSPFRTLPAGGAPISTNSVLTPRRSGRRTPLRSRWCSAHWIRRSAHCFMARRRQPWPCLAK